MNTKRSHKIFAIVMLVLMVGSIVASAGVALYNVVDYKAQKKAQEEVATALAESASEATSETASEE